MFISDAAAGKLQFPHKHILVLILKGPVYSADNWRRHFRTLLLRIH